MNHSNRADDATLPVPPATFDIEELPPGKTLVVETLSGSTYHINRLEGSFQRNVAQDDHDSVAHPWPYTVGIKVTSTNMLVNLHMEETGPSLAWIKSLITVGEPIFTGNDHQRIDLLDGVTTSWVTSIKLT